MASKVDPFLIWSYAIISVGYYKVFKGKPLSVYFATIFGVWLVSSAILFFAAPHVPYLSMLIQ